MRLSIPHWTIRQREQQQRGWHRWFAWRPVRVDQKNVAWLEFVERHIWYYTNLKGIFEVEYRLPPPRGPDKESGT
jgi:hypothetical protein